MSVSDGDRKAVLVDQHPLWLDAVEQVLDRVGVEVVGKATSLAEGTELLAELRPDLVVLEIEAAGSDTDGVAWLGEMRQRFPELKVIVLSTADEPGGINAAFSAGAVAYVVKKADPDDLAVAVRQTFEQSIYLPSATGEVTRVPATEHLDYPGLTRRELEILQLVAEGLSNAELARLLWVTEQTVKFHLSNIYRKLGVPNRTGASRWAQLHGLLPAQSVKVA